MQIAPTTPLYRTKRLVENATSFIYCVSLTGVTGALTHEEWTTRASHNVKNNVRKVQHAFQLLKNELPSITKIPSLIAGFGISR